MIPGRGLGRPMTRTQTRISAILLLAAFFGSYWWFFPTFSSDLMAVWLAGSYMEMGRPDQVYPAVTDYFLMYPPSEWRDFMWAEYEYDGPIYPYLYPPIWAKLAALISGINFWVVTVGALLMNSALQMVIIWLALRAVRPANMSASFYVFLALVFMLGTHVGTISLQQNQPQIFVSFLLVLAIERSRNGADRAAGAALAIAAALKLYPAIFAVFWLVTGNWRALKSFAVVGIGLGAISVIWAGWPLHLDFLAQVRLISDSVLMTAISFNLDAAVSQLFFFDELNWVPALEPATASVPDPGWYSMVRPTIWKVASNILLISALAYSAYLYRRADHDTRHALIWPFALTLISVLSPLTWVYYFIPTVCFAPAIVDRLGLKRGLLLWSVPLLLIFGPFVDYYRVIEDMGGPKIFAYQWAGFLSFSLLSYAFWQASRASAKELRPGMA